jgi:hypothetical protein
MRRLLNEVACRLLVVSEMIFGDKGSLTATFLVHGKHKYSQNVVLSGVSKFSKNFPVGVKFEGRLVTVRLIKPK